MPDDTRNYQRRVQRLLSDETYGPMLARLNRADTARVLTLVQQNKPAEARAELVRLDAERRKRETEERDRRARQIVIDHILRTLTAPGVVTLHPPNTSTIALGVRLMTRQQRRDTVVMDAAELQANAGDHSHIQWASPYGREHNPWWYH